MSMMVLMQFWKRWGGVSALIVLLGCSSASLHSEQGSFNYWQDVAEKQYSETLSQVVLEENPSEVERVTKEAIRHADSQFAAIVALKKDQRTFENTVAAIDRATFESDRVNSRIYLLMNVSTDKSLREKAQAMVEVFEKWGIDTAFRQDLYLAFKEYQEISHDGAGLKGEDLRLYRETAIDFKRNGFELSEEKRTQFKELQKQLSEKQNQFQRNIAEYDKKIQLSDEEVMGIDAELLKELPRVGDHYEIRPAIATQVSTVMAHAVKEEVRKKTFTARMSVAKDINLALLKEIVHLRASIAHLLGYKSWADFKTERLMAKNSNRVSELLQRVSNGVQTKFNAETDLLRQRKQKDFHHKVGLNIWDVSYYENLIKKEQAQIDMESLRVFFPMDKTLQGMFEVYSRIFGIKIIELEKMKLWNPEVRVFLVLDKAESRPLGLIYMDLFPREGKYTHFANFPLINSFFPGENSSKGQLSVSALICNFPAPVDGKPSLLRYSDVETLFHEFGHALHVTFSHVKYMRFSGTNVPRDFVEMPSQMLEEWVRDKNVLDIFAADYRDPQHKLDGELLKRLEKAEKLFKGTDTRVQLTYGIMDQYMHTALKYNEDFDLQKITNQFFTRYYLPVPSESAFVAGFGHIAGGYDANYYGYIWSEIISKDLAESFRKAPLGLLDPERGMKLRREIYQQGNSRDVEESVKAFLGRPYRLDAFLNELGIQNR